MAIILISDIIIAVILITAITDLMDVGRIHHFILSN